ncbi:lipopolysaccharide biosynthesis protein [Acetivibrio ethanolgignens]|uniref:Polysaccharide biosynthesis protein n=1 Tax=Acetivibrio ethanolgignens TaxID=290052 RepID=A0A0V8QAC2_9FIRM|nr:hypothetical protein [Acetivibrio ethanolgignens]KSV57504.1 hypothetical protein ASU35_04825 [Acetivibrio ethanolgignens]
MRSNKNNLFEKGTVVTFINYITKIFLNPIIVLFVPVFLTEEVQGYWYTFGSIAALTSFADLGFTSIMTQYTAHEYTYLTLDEKKRCFVGDNNKLERIASLFKFIVKWIIVVLCIAFLIIATVGCIIFTGKNDNVYWLTPWILYVFGTVINFSMEVGLSFFEGCSQFHITQKIRIVASTTHCLLTIVLLVLDMNLFALAIPLYVKAAIVAIGLLNKYGFAIKQMVAIKNNTRINWIGDIIPLLIRYAVSWMSGYFAQQIYNPIAFSRFSASEAGLVGYCISIVSAIYSVANVWNLLAVPQYNMAVEKKDWRKMDYLMKKNLLLSIITYIIGIAALFGTSIIPFSNRLIWSHILSPKAVVMLAINYLCSIIIYVEATYLRAHKKEPFMIISVCSGLISSILTLFFTNILGIEYMFLGLMLTNIIILPVSVYIWKKCRMEWHKNGVFEGKS